MPHQANTDADLSRAGHKQRANGARLMLIGGALLLLGLIPILLAGDENIPFYIGVVLWTLAAPPTIAGLGLFVSGLVSGRTAKHGNPYS